MWIRQSSWDDVESGDLIRAVRRTHRVGQDGWPARGKIDVGGSMAPIELYIYLGEKDGDIALWSPDRLFFIEPRNIRLVSVVSHVDEAHG